ncbi:hypothetical protein EYF80_037891 [Liparis tanakae]|uniref:Uncharacterized protein n=1 Tax=Liparis tanakae TaxID=230148 RepID=A0A4Z2GF59_9TELE|nr:hypothetical protein EYF80_037891 [Liparis tanakae]
MALILVPNREHPEYEGAECGGKVSPPVIPHRKGGALASHGGRETRGHSHGTRTHQQVLVMGAILGLKVTDEQ